MQALSRRCSSERPIILPVESESTLLSMRPNNHRYSAQRRNHHSQRYHTPRLLPTPTPRHALALSRPTSFGVGGTRTRSINMFLTGLDAFDGGDVNLWRVPSGYHYSDPCCIPSPIPLIISTIISYIFHCSQNHTIVFLCTVRPYLYRSSGGRFCILHIINGTETF